MIELLLLVPLAATFLLFPMRRRRAIVPISVSASTITLAMAAYLAYRVYVFGTIDEGLLYMDMLSAYVLLLVAFVGLAANLY
ncbi:MAG TPA: hydrogenase 4 subunit F, partial [Methanomassiliicoccaceae archaeon]|nr:hydrogenase 4 subunit F [Methanomassiliicoccaceae archaeon]